MNKLLYCLIAITMFAMSSAQGGLLEKKNPPKSPPPVSNQQGGQKTKSPPLGKIEKSSPPVNNSFNNYNQTRSNPFDNYNQVRSNPFDNYNLNNSKNRKKIDINIPGGSLASMVLREENVKVLRQGYYQYNSRWRDNDFYYHYYSFIPSNNCHYSPWYYYPHLPGYIVKSRAIIVAGSRPSLFYGVEDPYWHNSRVYYNFNRNIEIENLLQNITIMFERKDRKITNQYCQSNVGIFLNEQYCYNLNSDDFFDLMWDNIKSTNTIGYNIIETRTYGNEIRVMAIHRYRDPWGDTQSVRHVYKFIRYGDQYIISSFGTLR